MQRGSSRLQLGGADLQAEDGPRGVLEEARREADRETERALELVHARVSRARRLLRRARGDGRERLADGVGELLAAQLEALLERRPQGVDLGADGQRGAFEQLRSCVLRREARRQRAAVAPRGPEPEVDEGRLAVGADDDVRRLDVAVKEPCSMKRGQLGARHRQRIRPRLTPLGREHIRQALTDHELAHEEPPRPSRERAERHHPRHAEPHEPRQGDGLAHERLELRVARAFGEHLEREARAADAVLDLPHLSRSSGAETLLWLVPRGQRERLRGDGPPMQGLAHRRLTSSAASRGRSWRSDRTRTP